MVESVVKMLQWTRTKLKTSRPLFLFVKEVRTSEHFHSVSIVVLSASIPLNTFIRKKIDKICSAFETRQVT
ncbi:unnamed protein product [Timema podura]|uniref:Uncharacterized protein n=1 Tax=Timema podura TaxID=61482 RepID=A0ABN7NVS3_TIMPD|nr:unnamed protein product [Timema podura]